MREVSTLSYRDELHCIVACVCVHCSSTPCCVTSGGGGVLYGCRYSIIEWMDGGLMYIIHRWIEG